MLFDRLKELQQVSEKLKVAHERLIDQLEHHGISEEVMDQLIDLHRRYYSLQKDLNQIKQKLELEQITSELEKEMDTLDKNNEWLKNHFR
ncbi:hypothetical protein PEDI_44160 [Persicobacter diffluens]|uniref:Uncharacterized protein n=2 Tax=Persicobacter diffluens TaxID=981 RepID=A0AAN5AM01_9BACT|nr:hypothetical protein PEDI_44160 [Persicobacter diffluens]